MASLLHDDVLDDAETRRGIGSLNIMMGNKVLAFSYSLGILFSSFLFYEYVFPPQICFCFLIIFSYFVHIVNKLWG